MKLGKNGVLEYRQDIDGLRAIAVLSVLFFHAFPTVVPNGYLGVDIFFVISGFLITNIIVSEIETNSFTITKFYQRRIKRIFPALLLVLSTSFAIGFFTLLPDEFVQLSKHLIAGILFASNFLLKSEVGYFDTAAELLTRPKVI